MWKGFCDPKSRSSATYTVAATLHFHLLYPSPSLDNRACNSGEYDLVLLTGLIISTGREVADVSTFSHPILASSPRLCHRRIANVLDSSQLFFIRLPTEQGESVIVSMTNLGLHGYISARCPFFFSYFSPVTFLYRVSKRFISRFHEKRTCQARYILRLWYIFLFKVVLEYRVDLECDGKRRRTVDWWNNSWNFCY